MHFGKACRVRILLQVSPVVNNGPRNNLQINGDVSLVTWGLLFEKWTHVATGQRAKEARVRFGMKSSAGMKSGDVWKRASIIGSQNSSRQQ